jgi:hypothetical protein
LFISLTVDGQAHSWTSTSTSSSRASKAGLAFVDLVVDGQHPLGLLHRRHPCGPTASVASLDSSTLTSSSMARLTPGLSASTLLSMARLTPELSIISVDIVVDDQPPCWTLIFVNIAVNGQPPCWSSLDASISSGVSLLPASALDFYRCQPPRWTFIISVDIVVGGQPPCWTCAFFFVDIVVNGQRILLDLNFIFC